MIQSFVRDGLMDHSNISDGTGIYRCDADVTHTIRLNMNAFYQSPNRALG